MVTKTYVYTELHSFKFNQSITLKMFLEQLNISTKVIEDTIKQQYSEIQSHLESNGSEGQDYKILSGK